MAFRHDVGTRLRVFIRENGEPVALPDGTVAVIRIQKPNRHVLTKTATIVDGETGELEYFAEAGVFDLPGQYLVQGSVAFGGGTWSSNVRAFTVNDILTSPR
jgi:hypothetical protein